MANLKPRCCANPGRGTVRSRLRPRRKDLGAGFYTAMWHDCRPCLTLHRWRYAPIWTQVAQYRRSSRNVILGVPKGSGIESCELSDLERHLVGYRVASSHKQQLIRSSREPLGG